MTTARILIALSLLAAVAAGGDRPVVSDVRLIAGDGARWTLRVQSSAAQGFDVLPSRSPLVLDVRLHGARLGALPALHDAPFGSVRVREDGTRDVLLRVRLDDTGWRARVVQGGRPEVVEVRVER
jgi:hypothetical protein